MAIPGVEVPGAPTLIRRALAKRWNYEYNFTLAIRHCFAKLASARRLEGAHWRRRYALRVFRQPDGRCQESGLILLGMLDPYGEGVRDVRAHHSAPRNPQRAGFPVPAV